MEKVNKEQLQINNRVLASYLDLALENGYRVFKSYYKEGNPFTYFHYEKGGKIGYIQADFSGINVSTVHRPTSGIGTGFGCFEDHQVEVSLEILNEGLAFAPNWVGHGDRSRVEKWSFDSWINQRGSSYMVEVVI